MATEPILQLRDGLVGRLSTELSAAIGSTVTVEPRYVPYLDPNELETPRWILVMNADSIERQGRGLAPGEMAIDVGFQAALPPKTDRTADFFKTETLDGWVEQVGKLKALYRPKQPAGKLRDEVIAGAEFRRYTNAPLYRQEMLVAHGIFISVVSLVYYYEHNDD
jgi:hypothetical protein